MNQILYTCSLKSMNKYGKSNTSLKAGNWKYKKCKSDLYLRLKIDNSAVNDIDSVSPHAVCV